MVDPEACRFGILGGIPMVTRRAQLLNLLAWSIGGWAANALAKADAAPETYTYDELGRLTGVTYGDGTQASYAYDAAGNRTSVSQGPPPPPPPPPLPTFTATITLTSGSRNLRDAANAAGYPGQNATITFQLSTSVIGDAGAPNGGIALDTGTWPSGVTLALTLQVQSGGKVYGGGGAGGDGAFPGSGAGVGGDAIFCRVPLNINVEVGGEIRGGGGGGGGGIGNVLGIDPDLGFLQGAGGGGGGGQPNGPGGAGGNGTTQSNFGSPGTPGTTTAPGTGGAGDAGTPGGTGGVYAGTGANSGSTGGWAIRKNGNTVPVSNFGTITGTVG